MTDGMAASRSTSTPTTVATLDVAISDRNTALPIPRGTAISSATADVTSVPYRAGSAPNSSATGSHVVPVRNPIPPFDRASPDRLSTSHATPARTVATPRPARTRDAWKAVSTREEEGRAFIEPASESGHGRHSTGAPLQVTDFSFASHRDTTPAGSGA